MPTINPRGINPFVAALPEWSSEENHAMDADVFIAAVGFEERMPVLLARWLKGTQRKLCVLVRYATNAIDNNANWEKCYELLRAASVRHEEIQYDQRTLAVKVSEKLGTVACGRGVCVDISTMASFVFFPVLHSLLSILDGQRLEIAYVEAEEYYPSKEDWSSYAKEVAKKDLAELADYFDEHTFQSKGAESIYECLYHIGRNPNQLPVKLVLIPSFSFNRVFCMRSHAEQNYSVSNGDIEWIIGRPPNLAKNGWRANAMYALCKKPQQCSYCCTHDYKDILLRLHSIWEDSYLEKAMCIATMGSKAQHLGTLIFLLLHPEVSLLLSEPKEFMASRFSKGFGIPQFISFGPVSEFRKKVSEWNLLEFHWD